jgi:hypothetical protein
MLRAKKPKSKVAMGSSSIKLSKETKISNSFINFKQMEMTKFKTSLKFLSINLLL